MNISHKHKAIFCHIARTGGTSVWHTLKWARISHNTWGIRRFDVRFDGEGQHIIETQPDYFVFTTVRDPYTRYLSGVRWLEHEEKNPKALNYWKNRPAAKQYFIYEHITATQCEILGDLKPGYIMRFENLEEDFEVIREAFNIKARLPKMNGTHQYGYDSIPLTDEVIEFVNNNYAEDFKRFGYDRR